MTLILSSSLQDIEQAARIIKKGGLVAFGTETVYGLGADATNNDAVAKIYHAKGRPEYNPLISHFANIDSVFEYAERNILADQLASQFWPGPLTLILKQRPHSFISPITTANLSTMAVRVPNTETARLLIKLCNTPIAAPSANRSGKISPSCAQHVITELNNKIDAIIDSGPCQVGVESTILDISSTIPILLRPGGIPLESLTKICGSIIIKSPIETTITAPGQLSSHYAPTLPVRLNCLTVSKDEALLAFGEPIPHNGLCKNLSLTKNLEEAAQNLFSNLRFLDTEGQRMGLKSIAVMPIPKTGLGLAICDRLQRASAPRS